MSGRVLYSRPPLSRGSSGWVPGGAARAACPRCRRRRQMRTLSESVRSAFADSSVRPSLTGAAFTVPASDVDRAISLMTIPPSDANPDSRNRGKL